jgi:hypothetical protein
MRRERDPNAVQQTAFEVYGIYVRMNDLRHGGRHAELEVGSCKFCGVESEVADLNEAGASASDILEALWIATLKFRRVLRPPLLDLHAAFRIRLIMSADFLESQAVLSDEGMLGQLLEASTIELVPQSAGGFDVRKYNEKVAIESFQGLQGRKEIILRPAVFLFVLGRSFSGESDA